MSEWIYGWYGQWCARRNEDTGEVQIFNRPARVKGNMEEFWKRPRAIAASEFVPWKCLVEGGIK